MYIPVVSMMGTNVLGAGHAMTWNGYLGGKSVLKMSVFSERFLFALISSCKSSFNLPTALLRMAPVMSTGSPNNSNFVKVTVELIPGPAW